MTREEIIEKIRKVEALYSGTDSIGEKQAALGALVRLQSQLGAVPEKEEEFQVSMPDPWKRQLFLALCRRHGVEPFRRYRQRYSTVMFNCAPSIAKQILWPQYLDYRNYSTNISTKRPAISLAKAFTPISPKRPSNRIFPAHNCTRGNILRTLRKRQNTYLALVFTPRHHPNG